MPTIAFIQGKGGTSKTTDAVLIAYALARKGAGLQIGVCDLDHNSGATNWLTAHPHELIKLLLTADDDDGGVDLRLIDTEGRSRVEQSLTYLPKNVDLFIVPCGPARLEINGAKTTVGVLKERRPQATIRLLWTRVTKSANNSQPAVLAAHAKEIGAPAFRGVISRSTKYEDAQEQGWAALGTPHREEIEGIAIETLALLAKLTKA